jgi:hypothetical protein
MHGSSSTQSRRSGFQALFGQVQKDSQPDLILGLYAISDTFPELSPVGPSILWKVWSSCSGKVQKHFAKRYMH